MLADLQTQLDDARGKLHAHETTVAELAYTIDKQRSNQIELERRLTALEAAHRAALEELRATRQRHQQHLTRLAHSVETQTHAVGELEQILDAQEH